MKKAAVTGERQRVRAVWGSFLRMGPVGGARDKDCGEWWICWPFPREGPGVFFFALFDNPRDHLGCGGKHVVFSCRFYLKIGA